MNNQNLINKMINEEILEGTKFITLNGDYKIVTVAELISTIKGDFYTILEGSEIFTKEEIINQLSKHDILLLKLQKQEEKRIQESLRKK